MALGLVAGLNPGNVVPKRFDVGQIIRGWDNFAENADALRRQASARWIAVFAIGCPMSRSSPSPSGHATPMRRRRIPHYSASRF
jgi:hypothetical protein